MTTGPSYERVFDRLKGELGSWNRLSVLGLVRLKALIADAGLSNQKAPRLLEIASRLKKDFGTVSLDLLHEWDNAAAEQYLTSLPGVGLKTAKCVLMYSLSRQVLPVDTHVHRVSKRLGLLPDASNRNVHSALEDVVEPASRYAFHVNAVAHGRELCRAIAPLCSVCPLRDSCEGVSRPAT